MKSLATLSLLALAGGVVLAPPASADERVCTSAIGAETVDDLRVPAGATCTLDGTVVEGNVVVERDATLTARGVRVDGSVQSEGMRQVTVSGSRVGGSVQLKQGGGADVRTTTVNADIQYDANSAQLLAVDNTVGGNVQVVGNRGGADITGNTIDGNLQCKENAPAPTGSGNVVQGSAEDQCAALTGGSQPQPEPQPEPQPSGRFCDTAGHQHEASIGKVADAGIAQGGADGCFRPDDAVTRGQMATFLSRGYQLPEGTRSFCDTSGHVHEPGIRAAADAGIAQGGSDGCYRPNAPVTRGQMAAFLARAEQLAPASSGGFCDTAGHTHEGSVGAVSQAGIAQGYSNGCFGPDAPVTRGQMAVFLVRALGL